MRLTIALMLVLFACLAPVQPVRAGDDPESLARAALALCSLPTPPPAPPVVPDPFALPDYDAGRQQADETGQDLIVFVATDAEPTQLAVGVVNARAAVLFGDPTPRVVVSRWRGGKLLWRADLRRNATAREIGAVRSQVGTVRTGAVPAMTGLAAPSYMQVCDANGCRMVLAAPQGVSSYATPVAAPYFSSGGCASGNCGSPALGVRRR